MLKDETPEQLMRRWQRRLFHNVRQNLPDLLVTIFPRFVGEAQATSLVKTKMLEYWSGSTSRGVFVLFHPLYKLPIRPLGSLDAFQPGSNDPESIYTVGIGDRMELGFLAGHCDHNRKSDVLRVGFHAAKGRRDERIHMFTPLAMTRESGDSYLLFSDPTLTLSKKSILTWYLGTPDVNPDDAIERIVRRMLEATGAKYLLIEGSSAGGFMSMRFASRFHNAVAVPKMPQTDLFRYRTPWLSEALRESGWSGENYESVMSNHPQRFRIADIYNNREWHRNNIVHYVQNIGDTTHVEDQLKPLLYELGAAQESFSVRRGQFSISRPFTGAGHVAMPKAYWIAENQFALNRLRRMRPEPTLETKWQVPTQHTVDPTLVSRRIENLALHLDGNRSW
ncbi:hypothetical protein SLW73_07420 [Glutamicibacter protophormiae]|uniref:hypothetical protein n=1 Tax=Glutamicibacter protophormiae TaxID=37930 RepID=UPI002A816B3B|nr:hypothetical protein [Glutamicibacter protophormiae]WPR66136.1 hypothetical protein SLW72_07425 [Glutamicibacter protophormiae]WPR69633.1 hypothetical protein SLW73_07420 [Glutamicibacter protophormiae]